MMRISEPQGFAPSEMWTWFLEDPGCDGCDRVAWGSLIGDVGTAKETDWWSSVRIEWTNRQSYL